MRRTYALIAALAVSGLTAVVVALGGGASEVMPAGGSEPIVTDPVDRDAAGGEGIVRSASPIAFSARGGGLYVVRQARG